MVLKSLLAQLYCNILVFNRSEAACSNQKVIRCNPKTQNVLMITSQLLYLLITVKRRRPSRWFPCSPRKNDAPFRVSGRGWQPFPIHLAAVVLLRKACTSQKLHKAQLVLRLRSGRRWSWSGWDQCSYQSWRDRLAGCAVSGVIIHPAERLKANPGRVVIERAAGDVRSRFHAGWWPWINAAPWCIWGVYLVFLPQHCPPAKVGPSLLLPLRADSFGAAPASIRVPGGI